MADRILGPNGYDQLLTEDEAEELLATDESGLPRCSAKYAFERAKLLLGCYPRNQADDPDTYATAVAAILGGYPEPVVKRVTDPRIGVARSVKFLPSVSEVADVCDREINRGVVVRQVAARHLKARRDPRYLEVLEDILGRPVGRKTWVDDQDKATRAARLITSAVKGLDPKHLDLTPKQAAE